MRGRGWLSSFSVGDPAADRGVPLVSAFRWDTGVQVHAGQRRARARTVAVTTGTLGEPAASATTTRGRQVAGRVALQPVAGPDRRRVGRARAVRHDATRCARPAPTGDDGAFTQTGVGRRRRVLARLLPASGSRRSSATGGCRSSARPRSTLPLRAVVDVGRRPLQAAAGPLRRGARRSSRLQRDRRHRRGPRPWDAPVTRVEVGGGYSLQRNLLLKLSFQRNTRDGGRAQRRDARRGAARLLVLMTQTQSDTQWRRGANGDRAAPLTLRAVLASASLSSALRVASVVRAACAARRRSSAAAQRRDPRPRRAAPRRAPRPSAGPTVAELGAPPARDAPDRPRSVVYLEAAPRGAFEQTEPGARGDGSAQRDVRAARARDHDRHDRRFPEQRPHLPQRVLALEGARASTSAATRPARSKSVRFDRPGIVRVFCDIHSHMNAFILVFSHPFFAMTDADGRYRIDNVPPGTYSVIAWNEGHRVGAEAGDGARRRRRRARLRAPMNAALLAAQPHLPGERAAGGAVDRRRHLPRQRPRHPRGRERAAARDRRHRRARRAAADDARRDVHA